MRSPVCNTHMFAVRVKKILLFITNGVQQLLNEAKGRATVDGVSMPGHGMAALCSPVGWPAQIITTQLPAHTPSQGAAPSNPASPAAAAQVHPLQSHHQLTPWKVAGGLLPLRGCRRLLPAVHRHAGQTTVKQEKNISCRESIGQVP